MSLVRERTVAGQQTLDRVKALGLPFVGDPSEDQIEAEQAAFDDLAQRRELKAEPRSTGVQRISRKDVRDAVAALAPVIFLKVGAQNGEAVEVPTDTLAVALGTARLAREYCWEIWQLGRAINVIANAQDHKGEAREGLRHRILERLRSADIREADDPALLESID